MNVNNSYLPNNPGINWTNERKKRKESCGKNQKWRKLNSRGSIVKALKARNRFLLSFSDLFMARWKLQSPLRCISCNALLSVHPESDVDFERRKSLARWRREKERKEERKASARAFARPSFSFVLFPFLLFPPFSSPPSVFPFLRFLFSKRGGEFNLIKCRSFLLLVPAMPDFSLSTLPSRMTSFQTDHTAYVRYQDKCN